MEMIHVNIHHYEGRSTSAPMLIRVSPLYGYYNLSVYYFVIFYRPLWKFPRELKWVEFSVGTMEMPHVNIRHYEGRPTSGPMLIRVSPLSSYFNMFVYNFVIFYRPLLNIPPDLKWFYFSVNIRHYESPSTSGPMLIRVSPLYGYFNLSV